MGIGNTPLGFGVWSVRADERLSDPRVGVLTPDPVFSAFARGLRHSPRGPFGLVDQYQHWPRGVFARSADERSISYDAIRPIGSFPRRPFFVSPAAASLRAPRHGGCGGGLSHRRDDARVVVGPGARARPAPHWGLSDVLSVSAARVRRSAGSVETSSSTTKGRAALAGPGPGLGSRAGPVSSVRGRPIDRAVSSLGG